MDVVGLRTWEADGEESKRWARLEGQKSGGQDRLAMTRRDGVTRGRAATFMLGDGVHIFDQSTRLDFPQPTTPCLSAEGYHPLLRRSRCAHGAAQGAAEGVNGVLHRVHRVRVVCVGCLAPVLVTCTVLV